MFCVAPVGGGRCRWGTSRPRRRRPCQCWHTRCDSRRGVGRRRRCVPLSGGNNPTDHDLDTPHTQIRCGTSRRCRGTFCARRSTLLRGFGTSRPSASFFFPLLTRRGPADALGRAADAYHTLYCLAGLSAAQHNVNPLPARRTQVDQAWRGRTGERLLFLYVMSEVVLNESRFRCPGGATSKGLVCGRACVDRGRGGIACPRGLGEPRGTLPRPSRLVSRFDRPRRTPRIPCST